MKKYNLTLFCIFLLLFTTAFASFTIPSYTYNTKEIHKAKNKASMKSLPLVFLISDEDTRCSIAANGTNDVFEEYRNKAVIVYCDSKENNYLEFLPKIVRLAIESPYTRNIDPITIITDPDVIFVYEIIPIMTDRNQRRSILKKVIKDVQKSISFFE